MAAGMAKVTIIGNLGGDPETRTVSGDKTVCNFSVAVNEKRGGEEQPPKWFRVGVWGKQGEACQQWLKKGSAVYIEGDINVRAYEKDGVKTFSLDVYAKDVKFLSSPQRESGDAEPTQKSAPQQAFAGGQDDDIPF